MNTKEILIAARAKIQDSAHWTQGAMARDSSGEAINSKNPYAVCWCSTGAIVAVTPDQVKPQKVFLTLGNFTVRKIETFNDSSTHEEVLEVFDKAIASL